MSAPTNAVQISAARARWRADLLNYAADEHRRIVADDSSAAAQAILAEATVKEAEATVHLDHADAAARLSAAKEALAANPNDPGAQLATAQAAQLMVELRGYWRGIGEYTGTRSSVRVVNHFPEPTDEEVLATHGESI